MPVRKFFLGIGLFIILTWMPWSILDAQAILYDFAQITNNGTTNVSSQLQVEVTDASTDGSQRVRFHFTNAGSVASSITAIYFLDGPLLAIAEINNGPDWDKTTKSGVSFSEGANPRKLPGWNISPSFKTTGTFSADANPPKQSKGVNPEEYVDIIFNLQENKTYADVITALNLGIADPAAIGSLRLGLHVQAIDNLWGESYINTPIPGSVLLLGSGLLGLGVLGWRRKKS